MRTFRGKVVKTRQFINTIIIFFLLASCHNFDYETDFEEGGTLIVTCYTTSGTAAGSKILVGVFESENDLYNSTNPPYGGDVSSDGDKINFSFSTDQEELYIGGFYDIAGDGPSAGDPTNAYSNNPVKIEKNETVYIDFYIVN